MKAQYYWSGHDPSGPDGGGSPDLNRRGAGSGAASGRRAGFDKCHVVAGDLIPAHPGDEITTTFEIDAASVWHASTHAGEAVSQIEVPYPYEETNQTWPETVGLGTCLEVDNLMDQGYCPPITVTVTAPAGTEDGWQQPWKITEDPTYVFGPSASTVESTAGALTSTTTVVYKWPEE